MKANITFDENNYIKRFVVAIDGEYEIDQETFEFDYLFCYHLVDGELVLDENKKQEQIEQNDKENEIAFLKRELYDTDYITARCFEEIMALDNKLTFIADFIAIVIKYSKQYKDVIANRKAWRQRIEELENDTK